ncbi:DUF397 domain-containing protein [Actinoallomurus acaciae]|uniref:DUF397 domain-containing protein n=1 Tax=Actinoallomurus acaciae TaxID=502577 RepID=A0ABV5YRP8_9ACTN
MGQEVKFLGLDWTKSSRSMANQQCVEVAPVSLLNESAESSRD